MGSGSASIRHRLDDGPVAKAQAAKPTDGSHAGRQRIGQREGAGAVRDLSRHKGGDHLPNSEYESDEANGGRGQTGSHIIGSGRREDGGDGPGSNPQDRSR